MGGRVTGHRHAAPCTYVGAMDLQQLTDEVATVSNIYAHKHGIDEMTSGSYSSFRKRSVN